MGDEGEKLVLDCKLDAVDQLLDRTRQKILLRLRLLPAAITSMIRVKPNQDQTTGFCVLSQFEKCLYL